MKAVDPNIKVGAVLTTPANWPDGIVGAGDTATWNQTVLAIAGPHIDFVILHWYPSGSTTAEALAKPEQVNDMMFAAREQITRYAGANSGRIGISMTETNTPAMRLRKTIRPSTAARTTGSRTPIATPNHCHWNGSHRNEP